MSSIKAQILNNVFVCVTHLKRVLYLCVLQDSAQEGVITRDIHRTFPAHDYFKDSDGDGQDSLYKICKVLTSGYHSKYLEFLKMDYTVLYITFLS